MAGAGLPQPALQLRTTRRARPPARPPARHPYARPATHPPARPPTLEMAKAASPLRFSAVLAFWRVMSWGPAARPCDAWKATLES